MGSMTKKIVTATFLAVVSVSSHLAQNADEPRSASKGFYEGVVTREGKQWRVNVNIESVSASVDFVDLDIWDVPFPLFVDGSKVRLEKPQPDGRPAVVFDGEVSGDAFSGRWSGFGVNGTFSLRRGIRPPGTIREEEVSFQNGEVKLSGTLFFPKSSEKFPAVVITHGSAPNERAGYRSWARKFTNNGIAALIYDKRGSGRSTGNTRSASMEDLADDALAGLHYLKTRKDIDGTKVGVAGHSQGGWIAPLAAVRSRHVAFVVASAAAAVTPAEQSIYHRAGVMRSQGLTEEEIDKATKLREKLYDLNRDILKGDRTYQQKRAAISQELIANKDDRWFGPAELPPQLAGEIPPEGALRLLFFDPLPVWEKLQVPAFVVWGDKDIVVPVVKSRTIIEKAQAKAGNRALTIKVFPNLDHGNNVVPDGGAWDFPRAGLELDRAIVEWVKQITRS
jgi:pimeloyl-ACP methyl ester carboxylesterase